MSNSSNNGVGEEENLFQLFLKGKKQYELLRSGKYHPRDSGYEEFVDGIIHTFRRVLELVSKQSLFSSNEEIDDILTSSLKYILVPYYLAYTYSKINDLEKRLESLKLAKILYKNYLNNCLNIGVLSEEEESIINRENKPTADILRTEKITRAKKKKELQSQLDRMEEELNKKGSEEFHDDEEHERETNILLIRLCAQEAIDEMSIIDQEIEILTHMQKVKSGETIPEEPKQPVWKGIKTPHGYVKTFVIDKRKEIKDKIFKPHHNLPTMTIEEAGEIEYRKMLEREKESARLKEEREKNKKDEDDEDDEEEIKKQREWDDWKDENPRGWGNTGSKGYVKY